MSGTTVVTEQTTRLQHYDTLLSYNLRAQRHEVTVALTANLHSPHDWLRVNVVLVTIDSALLSEWFGVSSQFCALYLFSSRCCV